MSECAWWRLHSGLRWGDVGDTYPLQTLSSRCQGKREVVRAVKARRDGGGGGGSRRSAERWDQRRQQWGNCVRRTHGQETLSCTG